MNVVIVNCFDTWQRRVEFVKEFFDKRGDKVTVVTSDYRHREKVLNEEHNDDYLYIHVPQYKTNISIKRIYSHIVFAKKAFNYIEKLGDSVDILYVLIPPNILAYNSAKYKKKHNNTKLILDVIDMWPESLIHSPFLQPISYIWKKLRGIGLNITDKIICECNLFKTKLESDYPNLDYSVIYMGKKSSGLKPIQRKLDENVIRFCWLGSVNNIIDIAKITELFKELSKHKQVELEIIGCGEKLSEFVRESEKNNCTVHCHGNIYDDKAKFEIMNKCHFGLNVMKSNVAVGLTMKSIDYFENGLPIINNIKGDTFDYVINEELGFNLVDGNIMNKIYSITENNYNNLSKSCYRFWNEKLKKSEVIGIFDQALEKILKG